MKKKIIKIKKHSIVLLSNKSKIIYGKLVLIDNNDKLTKEYFDHFYNTIYDDNYLINVLRK